MLLLNLDVDWAAFGAIFAVAVASVSAIAFVGGKLLYGKQEMTEYKTRTKHLEEKVSSLEHDHSKRLERLEQDYFKQ